MFPLLLLFLVGGGVWAFSRGGTGGSGGGGRRLATIDTARFALMDGRVSDRLGALKDSIEATAKFEKFQDPVFEVYGDNKYRIVAERPMGVSLALNRNHVGFEGELDGFEAMWDGVPDVTVGLEYLADVPNKALDRVRAMRARINATGGVPPEEKPGVASDGTYLGNMVAASRASLNNMASSLIKSYESISSKVEVAASVAEKLKVPVSDLKSEASSALSSAYSSTGKDQIAVMDKAIKDYGPIARTAISAVARAIEIGKNSAVNTSEEVAAEYIDLAGSIVLVIPVYGWIVGAALKGIAAIIRYFDTGDEDRARCSEELSRIRKFLEDTVNAKMPVPWHLFQVFGPDCPKGNTGTGTSALTASALKNQFFFSVMPVARKNHVTRWWAAASTFAAHPDVFKVFDALGRDASGGMIASDEQVMLVAAPIAAMYGYEVDELAVELWGRAPGWRAASESFRGSINGDDDVMIRNKEVPQTDDYGKRKQLNETNKGYLWNPGKVCQLPELKSYCEMPHNAWWLQWSVLAQIAFEIVEEWQKTRVTTFKLAAGLDWSKIKIV